MMRNGLSLILLTSLKCNADCDYCFQNNSGERMTDELVEMIVQKFTDYLGRFEVGQGTIYWQGGDALTLEPQWFLRAKELTDRHADSAGVKITHVVQSNLLGYSSRWTSVIQEMFGGQIGSSFDFPNMFRKARGRDIQSFNDMWLRKYREAVRDGINVGIISLINPRSLEIGAGAYYRYMVEEVGLKSLSVQPIFPGPKFRSQGRTHPVDPIALGHFLSDLFDIWIDKGTSNGVHISPFDWVYEYFAEGKIGNLACVWNGCCADLFLSIDPKGRVSPCDCWTTAYPEFCYGNIFTCNTMDELIESEQRRNMKRRPVELMVREDCGRCDYLSICHGGCPIHAYSASGDLFQKDPYCESYKILFNHVRQSVTKMWESSGML